MKIITKSSQGTIKLGKELGRNLKAGDIVGLTGELGSGKTTLVKGIAAGMGLKRKEEISSPSFVLIKEYSGRIPLFHFDLYRLDKVREIEYLGVEEYLFGPGVCVIEWAEKMGKSLSDFLQINLVIKAKDDREIEFYPHGKRYNNLIKKLRIS